MKYIQDQLKQEDNLSANQSEEAIWLLWQRNQELTKCLKQWEILLGDLGVDYNNITEGLQVVYHKLISRKICIFFAIILRVMFPVAFELYSQL